MDSCSNESRSFRQTSHPGLKMASDGESTLGKPCQWLDTRTVKTRAPYFPSQSGAFNFQPLYLVRQESPLSNLWFPTP